MWGWGSFGDGSEAEITFTYNVVVPTLNVFYTKREKVLCKFGYYYILPCVVESHTHFGGQRDEKITKHRPKIVNTTKVVVPQFCSFILS